ncbi:MAG: hypothetical protein JW908_02560 [Anaerolineales bacterium]|nr:hypothetical protein [Anaerolineales bacterium]
MNTPRFDQLTWLKKNENPFGLVCLDCRSFTQNMVTTTQDPGVARRFTELRAASGEEYSHMSLPDSVSITCALNIPINQILENGPIFKAAVMEEKWDIHLYENILYFSRSWTGDLIFKANVHVSDNNLRVFSIEINAMVNAKESAFIIRQVDFLIKSHILKQVVPHPLPVDLPNDKQTIALYSFSQYGRLASFATFEDTLMGSG